MTFNQLNKDCLLHIFLLVQLFVPLQITPKGIADLTSEDGSLTLSTLLSFPLRRQCFERDPTAHRRRDDQERSGAG